MSLRILILEDEPLIALLLEDWLAEMGHQPAKFVTTVPAALSLARETKFDAAILDVNVSGEKCYPVADLLRTQGVPFAFATGDSSGSIADPYADVPSVTKPYTFKSIEQTLAALSNPSKHQLAG